MGFYVEQGRESPDRVKWLLDNVPGARIGNFTDAALTFEAVTPEEDLCVLVAVNNPDWTAVGYAYNEAEFARFFQPSDGRPKRIILVPREAIETLIPVFPKRGDREWAQLVERYKKRPRVAV